QLLVVQVPALLRQQLILYVHRGGARILEGADHVHDVERLAVTRIAVDQHRQGRRAAHLADEEADVIDSDDPEVRQSHGRADRGAGEIQCLESLPLRLQSRESVVCTRYSEDAAAADELRESLACRLGRQILSDEVDAHDGARSSDDIEIDVLIDRRALEMRAVERQLGDRLLLLLREAPREIAPELLEEQRNALLPPATVADRILHHHLIQRAAVLQSHAHRIGDGALVRIEIIAGELRLLDTLDPRAQRIDARIA